MNKKMIIILLIFFAVLVIFYICLDKNYGVNNSVSNVKEITTYNNDSNYITLDYFDSCEDVNCYNIDLEELTSETIEGNTINVELKCNQKEIIDDKDYCKNINVLIDNKINIDIDTIKDYYYDNSLTIFKTNDHYVVKQVNSMFGRGILNIYSNDGNLLKQINNSITSYELVSNGEILEDEEQTYDIVINDNKLYYAKTDDFDYVLGLNNKVHIGYIELNDKLEYHELDTINAITSIGI